jgi:DNA-binding response OmpR family regulator
MKVLIAEDDRISRRLLEITLQRMNHEVVVTENGAQAWETLQGEDAPQLAVLDWMMPMMDGVDVCRLVRQQETAQYVYLILLTAKGQKEDIVAGLGAGADDYVIKPFDLQELRSRIAVGERIVRLESNLASKVDELEQALQHVKQLQGLLPICMFCKKIRDDGDAWHRLESYIEQNSEANFTHSVCGDCRDKHFPTPRTATS